jgi:hypothetical protein
MRQRFGAAKTLWTAHATTPGAKNKLSPSYVIPHHLVFHLEWHMVSKFFCFFFSLFFSSKLVNALWSSLLFVFQIIL